MPHRIRRRLAVLTALSVIAAGLAANETIQINRPLVSPASRDTERFLDEQFQRAVDAAQHRFDGLSVGYTGFGLRIPVERPTITVAVTAMDTAGSAMLTFNGTNRSGASESYAWLLPWHDGLYREIASILVYLTGVLGSGPESRPAIGGTESGPVAARPPVYFQEFVTDFISTGDTQYNTAIQPYGLGGFRDSLYIGAGTSIVEVDRYFRERRKIGLDLGLPGFWAWHLAVSPAGTIYAGSAAQSGLVRLAAGAPQPVRIPTPNPVTNLAVTNDGTGFTLDMQQTFRGYSTSGVRNLDLGLAQGTYISFMASGPDNTLLIWDPMHRAFFVYDAEGGRVDTIIPHLSMTDAMGLRYFTTYPDGHILVVLLNGLARLDRTGRPVWRVTDTDLPEVGQLAFYTSVYASPADGLISMVNIRERRVVQLLDMHEIERHRRLDQTEQAILDLNARLARDPLSQRHLADRARLYESIGAWELASYTWDIAYGLNPTNREVARAKEQVELRQTRANAVRLVERALGLLARFGPATAAMAYQQAQVTLERIISLDPGDRDSRELLQRLRDEFNEESERGRQRPAVDVTDVRLDDLFPGMLQVYRERPVGVVRLYNRSEGPVANVTVTAEMTGYLDFPVESGHVASIDPDRSAEIPVLLPISTAALELEETQPVAVRLTVRYELAGRLEEVSRTEYATLHRATALTWDDSAKLAAYVTPRDGIIERFAAAFASAGDAGRFSLSPRVFRAAHLVSALGVHGIRYVEDPESGITQVLGDPFAVDTVRFPRTTLRVRSGDCDDTTALLASLLEALGIPTAIMTSPGHVFLAFDTGEPAQNAWLFESATTVAIRHAGTVWLPVETTIFDRGFLASWQEGSRLYRNYVERGEIEFLPVADQRQRYPALPLDRASFDVMAPSASLVESRYQSAVSELRDTLYGQMVARLERELANQSDRLRARTHNRIGVLHARFAEPEAAGRAFREAIRVDPDFAAGYTNLANLEILAGNARDALRLLDESERRRPGDVTVTLLRAQAEHLAGNYAEARRQLAILAERAPELAANYRHLAADAGSRASEAQSAPMLPWAEGDAE